MQPMEQNVLKLAEELSNAKGASGFEDEVLAVARKYARNFAEIQEDSVRNLYLRYAESTGNKPVVMLDAHTDEVSFMVQAIKPNGTLRFISLGGWPANSIAAHRVLVRNAGGDYIPGITVSKPPHFMTEAEKKMENDISNMAIDIGAMSKEDAEQRFHIRIGEPVVPDVTFEYNAETNLMFGKAFDCRLGVASVIGTMKTLIGENLNVDVVGALASQEEVGTRGAKVTSRTVKPDIAIVFEGCPADDTFTEDYMIQTAVNKGPMLRFIDRAMITNPRFQRFALDLAEELGIPVQTAVRTGGSTNGSQIHLSNRGVPVIVVGVPVRYAHTHYGISSLSDCMNAIRLATEIIKRLNQDLIKSF
ncbi:M42 family metallopeptidase [Caproicibacter sp.]|uniref:M42 family metallopeptidase n=1 Tax=Caproicibacter sp. TaxID=2814884 RepID=UPI003988B5B0